MHPLQKVKSLPVPSASIEKAVAAFVSECNQYNVPYSDDGLYNQTVENISSILMNPGTDSHHLWLAWDGDEVLAYVLAHVAKDVDNSLCYWLTQAYVSPKVRRQPCVKQWFGLLRDEARNKFCKHIIIPASRNVKAYCRFLGQGWHPYVCLLKEDI